MNDYPCVVYDHECSGQSTGDVKKVTFTSWVEDALRVTSDLTEGPLVLVGSSTGGWLSIITALKIKQRLHGLGNSICIYVKLIIQPANELNFFK
jgi:pimeloyl-ACP methyl ester carboxylesterase